MHVMIPRLLVAAEAHRTGKLSKIFFEREEIFYKRLV